MARNKSRETSVQIRDHKSIIKEEVVKKPTKIPPDGGWGWIIVVAYGISNAIFIPVIGNFGLLFGDHFKKLNMSSADITTIINLNASFGMGLGLLNGPLLRMFGYRKIGLLAGVFFACGLFLTSFATKFAHYMITYGLITAAGYGMASSAFSLALNTYFRVNRNKAAGFAMTLTGLGPILFPPLITTLLYFYDIQGTVMIISAFSLHIILAACLLQPIKRHLIYPPVLPQIELIEEEKNVVETPILEAKTTVSRSRKTSFAIDKMIASSESLDSKKNRNKWEFSDDEEDDYLDETEQFRLKLHPEIDVQNIYGIDQTLSRRPSVVSMVTPAISRNQSYNQLSRSNSKSQYDRLNQFVPLPVYQPTSPIRKSNRRWFESGSSDSVHLASSVQLFNETSPERKLRRKSSRQASTTDKIDEEEHSNVKGDQEEEAPMMVNGGKLAIDEKPSVKSSSFKSKVIEFFDFDLLRDKVYVNLMLGMSIAIFAEINFSTLTPLILSDFGLSNVQIASVMSTLAIADIISRFVSPFIGDYLGKTPRIMYLISLLMLIVTRMSIIMVGSSYIAMLFVGVGLGIAKGVRTVYMNLVLPTYVPIERLASASGIQMLVNGLILIAVGPLLGLMRDLTGSYRVCIIFLNFVTSITVVMWTTEILYTRRQRKLKEREIEETNNLS